MAFRVVVAGGGTGGHVYPTLAVIDALRKTFDDMHEALEIVRIGPRDGYETLFENRGVKVSPIAAGKIRRYAAIANITDVPKFFIGFLQALFKLYILMPDVIFSKGGTGALPVVIAGWFYRIPIAIHETDAQPGLTNLFSARFARKIFVNFERAAAFFNAQKVERVGIPMRNDLFAKPTTKELAKDTLGFSAVDPLLLVLGGSQGSQQINIFILENLAALTRETQILHQTGMANIAEVEKLSRAALIDESFRNRYHPVGYFTDNFELALIAADLVVTRAGGTTLAEIAAFKLPAIIVPLRESGNDHQRINAYEFAKTGGAVIIEESNFLPGIFFAEVKKILSDDGLRAKMGKGSGTFFIAGAAEKIAEGLMKLAA